MGAPSIGAEVSPDAEARASAVRLLDETAAEAHALGAQASPEFRRLVGALEGRQVVVHVIAGRPPIFGAVGSTRLVGKIGTWLYVRVVLDARVRVDKRAAVLAHELRHVLEIVAAAAATQDDMRRLYERIGQPAGGMLYAYETDEAIAAGLRVLREIHAFNTTHPLPTARAEAPQ